MSPSDLQQAAGPSAGESRRQRRILVVYYSQSGDADRALRELAAPLAESGSTVVWERLRPLVEFPFPWKSVYQFFNVMPECILGRPPENRPPTFHPEERFDLVVLGYQVWFLSPSLPTQAFLRTAHAGTLKGTPVVTLSVSRNMWHNASLTMKRILNAVGAIHVDNIVITHQGPVWATFLSTPRRLLSGKNDPLWKGLPPSGLGAADLEKLRRFGQAIAEDLDLRSPDESRPFLSGLDPAPINRRYIIPELVGWYMFAAWAHVLSWLGRCGPWVRRLGLYCFVIFLGLTIGLGIPAGFLGTVLLYPFVRKPMAAYIKRLKAPSG